MYAAAAHVSQTRNVRLPCEAFASVFASESMRLNSSRARSASADVDVDVSLDAALGALGFCGMNCAELTGRRDDDDDDDGDGDDGDDEASNGTRNRARK